MLRCRPGALLLILLLTWDRSCLDSLASDWKKLSSSSSPFFLVGMEDSCRVLLDFLGRRSTVLSLVRGCALIATRHPLQYSRTMLPVPVPFLLLSGSFKDTRLSNTDPHGIVLVLPRSGDYSFDLDDDSASAWISDAVLQFFDSVTWLESVRSKL